MPAERHAVERIASFKKVGMNIHITCIRRERNAGYYTYFNSPRIGIDIWETGENDDNPDFIPNINLGDLIRFVIILGYVDSDEIFAKLSKGSILPFEIAMEFKRKIVVSAEGRSWSLSYHDPRTNWKKIEYYIEREGIAELRKALKEIIANYLNFVNTWLITDSIDASYLS